MNEQETQAFRALMIAAERIGEKNFRRQYERHIDRGRKSSTFRYDPTPAHRLVVETAEKLGLGQITAEEAMAVLHIYEVEQERFS